MEGIVNIVASQVMINCILLNKVCRTTEKLLDEPKTTYHKVIGGLSIIDVYYRLL